ncbi:extracellular solute-binding protein [Saccharospirillum salsuginis]|uniref:ABC transporter substrate-binding protein n=1 Tax=Saccharospirillum salsuginis TaxID=418750 RepID=A0A918JZI8_9GAMM|nr:extracellular solute-binding protein [Saccharospirillum salsuginis]GGX39476.1 ABC transporter substrate-binding protein [Saccharospirillum salsuginis]
MKALVSVVVGLCLAGAVLAEEPDVIVSHAIAERGEPQYPEGFEHWDYVNPDAPRKGYITLGVRGTFDNFNRFAQRGTTPAGIRENLFDPLMVANGDEMGVYYGLIAEKVEYPTSHDWIIFHLDPRATFQDGEPILASDVAFTFNLFMEDGVPQFSTYYEGVSVEVLDDRKVKFTLPRSDKALLIGLVDTPVFPEHVFKDIEFPEPLTTVPVGSGAYTISDYKMGQYVVYKRIDDYWALNHPTRVGQLNFDFERYDYYLDDTVLLEAFKKGEYDFRRESVSKNWATQYEGDNFEKGHIVKEEISHDLPHGMQSFVFNIQQPVFEDRRVRMAINLLFDFEWTNENLFYGKYERTRSYFQNTDYMATGLPEGNQLEILEQFRDQVPPEVFTEPYESYETDGSGNIRPQLRQALGLLQQAGYELQNGKMVNLDSGEPITFELLLYSPNFERVAIPFQENLARAGITMNIRTVDITQYTNRWRERDYDMIVDTLGGGAYPSDQLVFEWDSRYMDSTYNAVGTSDPVIDALVRGIAENQQNEDMLLAYGRALDRVLLWRYYVVPNWHLDEYWVAYWNKFARPDTRMPRYSLGLGTWWLDEEAAATLPDRNAR